MNHQNFSDRIKHLCTIFNIDAIAEHTGISRAQLYRLRSGNRDTTRKNLLLLCEATECNLIWLATGEGPMMKGDPDLPPPPAPEFTNDEIEMIELFRAVSLKKKSEILNQLMNND